MARVKRSDISEADLLGDIRESAGSALKDVAKLNNELIDLAKNTKSIAKGLKFDSTESIKKASDAQKISNDLTREAIKLQQEEERLRKAVAQADIAVLNAREKERVINERAAKNAKNQLNAYKLLSDETRELKNESKRLAVELINLEKAGKRNTAEFKNLDRQYQEVTKDAIKLDKQLKSIDSKVGDNFRNVGNYNSALTGLGKSYQSITRLAANFGLALGGFEVLKGGLSTISEFQTSFADLMAVTGLNAKENQKDLETLKKNAIGFSKEFGTSARDVVEAFKLAGSARPELLKNADALSDLTKQAIILSKASGDDVPTSIKNLTGTLNAFEGDASDATEVMDTLANSAQLGTQEIPYLTDAFTKFGGIAKANNISIAESAAAVELLGKKFPDAATAGTGLRNVMLKLSAPDALPKEAIERLTALGVNFDTLQDKSKPFSERLEELKPLLNDNAALIKVFGSENALAAQTLIAGTKEIESNSQAYDKNGTAQDQATVKSKTLSEATARLKAQYEALFLGLETGGEGLTTVVDFLANNLGTIISLIGKVVIGFLAYKTALIAVNIQQQIADKGLKGIIKGFFDFKNGATGAGGAASKLGSALKGIGWTAIIALASELAIEFYNIASGAKLAEERTKAFEKAVSNGAKQGEIQSNRFALALKKQMQAIDLMNVSEKERIKLRKEATEATRSDIEKTIKQYEKLHVNTDRARKDAIAVRDSLQQSSLERGLNPQGTAALDIAERAVTKLTAKEKEQVAWIKELRDTYAGLNDDLHSLSVDQTKIARSTEKETKAVKEKTKAYKDAREEIEKTNALLKTTQELTDEIAVYEAEQSLEQAIENQIESINQSGQYSLDIINQRIQAEYDLRRAIIERQNIEEIDAATTEEEVINARKRRDFEIGKLDDEFAKRRKDINQQLEDAQVSYSDATKDLDETVKKSYDSQRELAKLLSDYFIEQSNRRIAQIDKEIQAAQNQYDYLQKLAENGNINAQQSLSEQQKIINEANLKKQQELKRQERIKLAQSVFDTYLGKLESGSKTPVIDTFKDITALRAFIEAIPKFKDGGVHDGGLMMVNDASGKDYREVIKTPDGKLSSPTGRNVIMNAPKGTQVFTQKQWGDELAKYDSFGNLRAMDNAGNTFDLMPLVKKFDSLEETIKNKKEFEMNVEQLGKGMIAISSKTKTGNDIIYNKFIAKS